MSKAFVIEDSDQLDADQEELGSDQDLGLDEDLGDDAEGAKAVFRTGKNYITQRGFDRLKPARQVPMRRRRSHAT